MDAFIRSLSIAIGPPGREEPVRQLIARRIEAHVDDLRVDVMGNLIAYRRGNDSSRRLLLSAHMDEVGIMITHIDAEGFLRFEPLGGLVPQRLPGQRFRFPNGVVGSVGVERLDPGKELQFRHLYLDIGARSADEAREQVQIGDAACYDQQPAEAGARLIGKAMDDRAGCAVLVEALVTAGRPACDLYAVFSVQEEVGARGARTAAFALEPSLAVAIDVTPCGDTPEGERLPVRMGSGAAIKVKDRSLLAHPAVKEHLEHLALAHGIPHQYEVLPFGGTDAGPIHLSRAGVPSGVISIPCRYLHTPAEMVDRGDLAACVELTRRLIESPLPSLG